MSYGSMVSNESDYEYNSNYYDNSNTNESNRNKAAYVAKGGFGCVVKPALDNVVGGVKKSFPGNVSKLFKTENSYNEALAFSNKAYNIMGKNEGQKLSRYEKKFKGSNLRRATRRGCKILGDKPLYVVRMKDLGKDIAHIEDYYKELREVPFLTMMEQIVKLFRQVHLAYTAGYVHGDIRETNIMANPTTGVLTLIDFDWFMPKGDFFNEYYDALGFYSNPPESLVVYELEEFKISKSEKNTKLEDYRNYANKFRTHPITREQMRIAHEKNMHYLLVQKKIQYKPVDSQFFWLCNEMFEGFDSYGLAMTMNYLFMYVYPGDLKTRITNRGVPYTAAEIKIIEDVVANLKGLFERMIHLEVSKRITIEIGYSAVEELLEEYKTKIAAVPGYTTPPKKVKPVTPPIPVAPPSSPVSAPKNRRYTRRRR